VGISASRVCPATTVRACQTTARWPARKRALPCRMVWSAYRRWRGAPRRYDAAGVAHTFRAFAGAPGITAPSAYLTMAQIPPRNY